MKIGLGIRQFLLYAGVFWMRHSEAQDRLLSACAPTHIRFTARHFSGKTIGEPVGNLTKDQLIVWLGSHKATILALANGLSSKAARVYTDILVVVPPFSGVEEPSVNKLIKMIAGEDNFSVRLAVLAPDGRLAPFTSDLTEVRTNLMQAISPHVHYRSRTKWPVYEEAAFMSLRKLPGRHVIVLLCDPSNPFHSEVKKSFNHDRTLDSLALFDASQIYRLLEPSSLDLTIPMGDASTEHMDIGPDNHAAYQAGQVSGAAEDQDRLWAQRNPASVASGGRDEADVDTLFKDIFQDAAGSYDSIVQGSPPCEIGRIYPANVSPTVPNIHIFGPTQIQLIPATAAQ